MELDALEKIGFDKGEIKVYVGLLKLGPSLVGRISKETGINRTHVYNILEKLEKRGFVGFVIENNKRHYSASDPLKIKNYIKSVSTDFSLLEPRLKQLYDSRREKVMAEIFRGKEGFKTILDDMFKVGGDFLVFGEEGQFQEAYPILFEKFQRELVDKHFFEKVLVKEGINYKKGQNSKIRIISKKYSSPTNTVVYGNRVQINVWNDPQHHILITSKELAESYKSYFGFFWKMARKERQK